MIEVDVMALSKIIGGESPHERIPDLGERVWMAKGKECDVVYWDDGNGMCQILQILPKKEKYKNLIMSYLKQFLDASENE